MLPILLCRIRNILNAIIFGYTNIFVNIFLLHGLFSPKPLTALSHYSNCADIELQKRGRRRRTPSICKIRERRVIRRNIRRISTYSLQLWRNCLLEQNEYLVIQVPTDHYTIESHPPNINFTYLPLLKLFGRWWSALSQYSFLNSKRG